MDWLKEINAAVTICDTDGIIVYMNERSAQVFESDGGKNLIGQSLFGCHPEPALTKLNELLANGSTNIYTIEKNGKKKMIYQTPLACGAGSSGNGRSIVRTPVGAAAFCQDVIFAEAYDVIDR